MGKALLMSKREHERLNILEEVKKRRLTIKEASALCEISERQFYRIKSSYDKDGLQGIIHKLRGRPSNRGFSESYRDFGPTFYSEKLEEYHQIKVDHETLRRWIRSSGHVGWHRQKRPHRKRRERHTPTRGFRNSALKKMMKEKPRKPRACRQPAAYKLIQGLFV